MAKKEHGGLPQTLPAHTKRFSPSAPTSHITPILNHEVNHRKEFKDEVRITNFMKSVTWSAEDAKGGLLPEHLKAVRWSKSNNNGTFTAKLG